MHMSLCRPLQVVPAVYLPVFVTKNWKFYYLSIASWVFVVRQNRKIRVSISFSLTA